MEGINMYHHYANYPFSHPYYSACYPYYHYWPQLPSDTLNYYYNQRSSPFAPSNDSYELNPFIKVESALLSEGQSLEDSQFIQKPICLTTRSKGSKQRIQPKTIKKQSLKPQSQQKENRNVYSNILRNFFRRVNDHSKIEGLVEQIIAKRQLTLTKNEFMDYLKRLKVNHGRYLRFKKLRPLFASENLKEHAMVFRILLQYFSKRQLLVQTLTSRKIGRWSVILHLKGTRELKERLFH